MRSGGMHTVIFFLIIAPMMHASAFAQDDGDWQLWVQESLGGNLSEKWVVEGKEEFRFGKDMRELHSNRTGIGIAYIFTDRISLSLNYTQIYDLKNGAWREENRTHTNLQFKWKAIGLTFEDRNRMEYRVRDDTEKSWRYRNKLTIALDVKWTKIQLQPFAADEVFVDFKEDELNRNRFYVGVKAKLMKHLKTSLHYLWQSSKKGEDWVDFNIVGIDMKFAF